LILTTQAFLKEKTLHKFFLEETFYIQYLFHKTFERKRPKETEMVIKSTNQVKKAKESSQNFKKK